MKCCILSVLEMFCLSKNCFTNLQIKLFFFFNFKWVFNFYLMICLIGACFVFVFKVKCSEVVNEITVTVRVFSIESIVSGLS